MLQHLAITVIGRHDPALPERLTGMVAECGCNILESRISILGQEFSMLLLLAGNWNAVVKVEDALARLGQDQELSVNAAQDGVEPVRKKPDALRHRRGVQ